MPWPRCEGSQRLPVIGKLGIASNDRGLLTLSIYAPQASEDIGDDENTDRNDELEDVHCHSQYGNEIKSLRKTSIYFKS